MLQTLLINIWQVFLETAFWLLIGLFFAGTIKTLISEKTMKRWVGGSGLSSIFRAALFGAPLPLCSCGVLPAAIAMRRAGASKEATVSFLISTPETSIDSVTVTYALLGPIMAIYRPIAALVSAVTTGILVSFIKDDIALTTSKTTIENCCSTQQNIPPSVETETSCCSTEEPFETNASCCSNDTASDSNITTEKPSRLGQICRYAAAELLDDMSKWMAFGIVAAGVMFTFIPADALAEWGQGINAMLIMLIIGIPMYICASASTPVAAGLLVAGVSPGAVLIFLLVGPATNIASFALLKNELGMKVTLVYLAGIACVSLLMGLCLEWLLGLPSWQMQGWVIETSLDHTHSILPEIVSISSALLLIFLAIKPLRRSIIPWLG